MNKINKLKKISHGIATFLSYKLMEDLEIHECTYNKLRNLSNLGELKMIWTHKD